MSGSTVSAGSSTGSRPILRALPRKMSAKRGRDDGGEAVVLQRPGGVLPGRAGAEVGAGQQDLGALVLGPVEDEAGVGPPGGEQPLAEAGPLDALEPDGGDDLVGVDVGPVEGDGPAGDLA